MPVATISSWQEHMLHFPSSSAPPVSSRISFNRLPSRPVVQISSCLLADCAGQPGFHNLIITSCAESTTAHSACLSSKVNRTLKVLQAFSIADPELANRTRADASRSESFLPCASLLILPACLPAVVPRSDSRSRLPLVLLHDTGISRPSGLINIMTRSSPISSLGRHTSTLRSNLHTCPHMISFLSAGVPIMWHLSSKIVVTSEASCLSSRLGMSIESRAVSRSCKKDSSFKKTLSARPVFSPHQKSPLSTILHRESPYHK
jgi:hypothetical protein